MERRFLQSINIHRGMWRGVCQKFLVSTTRNFSTTAIRVVIGMQSVGDFIQSFTPETAQWREVSYSTLKLEKHHTKNHIEHWRPFSSEKELSWSSKIKFNKKSMLVKRVGYEPLDYRSYMHLSLNMLNFIGFNETTMRMHNIITKCWNTIDEPKLSHLSRKIPSDYP